MATCDSRAYRVARAAALARPQIDALFVTNLHNVRYLTGFTGSNATLLLFRDARAVLFTDPRYTVQSEAAGQLRVVIAKGPLAKSVLSSRRPDAGCKVGFESEISLSLSSMV